MDFKEIKKIIEIMDKNGLVEFEYENNGKRIKLRRAEPRVEAVPVQVPASAAAPAGSAGPQIDAGAVNPSDNNVMEFKSPLVGTFYRANKPGTAPFVDVGDEVTPEKVVCIIEAMKVMNEIKAELSGIVKEVLVKNGQAVEFGEPLFLIEKK